MTPTRQFTDKAMRWGRLWGSRAQDWAAGEEQHLPTYEEAIRRVGIAAGQSVLDLGRAAADRGAEVFGLDASSGCSRSRAPACPRPTCASATCSSCPTRTTPSMS